VTIAALDDALWVMRERGSATRELFERRLAESGIKPKRAIELDSPEGIKALVAVGIGVSFLSIHAVSAELRRRELRRIRLEGLQLTRPLFLVHHPDKHISLAMQNLLELMRKRP
jgi:DNA-binding transcriptional LysR family regulator